MGTGRVNTTLVVGVLVVALLAGAFWFLNRIFYRQAPDISGGSVEVDILTGMSLDDVSRILEGRDLISSRSDFKWAARLMGVERRLQPGRFLLPRGVGNVEVLRCLMKPGIRTKDVTVPEGLTVREIAGIFRRELGLDSARFVGMCRDSAFAAELGIGAGSLEGYLFPDTYNFYTGSSVGEVIRRMTTRFNGVFSDSLRRRLKTVDQTLDQAVTLASIIQGEVMVPDEAPLISAVYHNRLKRRIPLAADPTIQYIIPDGPRRLLNGDLEIDSPYNTYKHLGLPPGPINNPGRVALEAAVNPAAADYIYFVAKGDGSHAFNSSHVGHMRDKAKFQQVRLEVARQRRTGGQRGNDRP